MENGCWYLESSSFQVQTTKYHKIMKQILNKLFEHQTLSHDEAKQILIEIAGEKFNQVTDRAGGA